MFPVFTALFPVFNALFPVFTALVPVFTFYSGNLSAAAYITFVCTHHRRLHVSASSACIISFLASCPDQPS